MKSVCLYLFCLLSLSSVYAQGKLPKESVTVPKNLTATFSKNQKFPTVILPCKLYNGKDRPYPCEFALLKLVFYDTNGSKIGEATQKNPSFTLPLSKAKSAPVNGAKGQVAYNVRATMTRISPPAFPPKDGYMVRSAFVTFALQSDPLTTHASGVSIPSPVNGLIEIPFTVSWLYEKSEGVTVGPREFYVENDVTTTKFPFSSAVPMRDKAEVSLVVQPKIDYTK